MQMADRAEIQSPSVWLQVDMLSTSCSCFVHVDFSTRNHGSGRDCEDSFSIFCSIDGKTPWYIGLFFFCTLNFILPCHSISVREKRHRRKSSSLEVQKCLVVSVPTLPLLVHNGNATKHRAVFQYLSYQEPGEVGQPPWVRLVVLVIVISTELSPASHTGQQLLTMGPTEHSGRRTAPL